jgi:hypothetical protein
MTYRRFTLDNSTPPLWRVTFDHPPINLIDSVIRGTGPIVRSSRPPQMDAFWEAVARPALQARASKAFDAGLQQRSDVELSLGKYVGQFAKDA